MNRFAIAKPTTFEQAQTLLTGKIYTLPVLKAGGMDLLDHMKEGLAAPDLLIDIKRLAAERSTTPDGIVHEPKAGRDRPLRIAATTTLAEIASSAVVRKLAPVLAQAAGDAATPQVRNVASAAGNLLQRPRCWYYRNEPFHCLKKGGHMCYAVEGENRFHAVFGEGPCHIVHPSSLAPPLQVCAGQVRVIGGERQTIDIADLYHMPEGGILDEHNLAPGEVITHLELQSAPASAFYAIKEKQSFDWPLVAAAVALELSGTRIQSARVCAAAVAPVPWRLPEVEQALAGVRVDDDAALRAACEPATAGARPMTHNAFKLKLLPVAVRRAVLKAAGRKVEG